MLRVPRRRRVTCDCAVARLVPQMPQLCVDTGPVDTFVLQLQAWGWSCS